MELADERTRRQFTELLQDGLSPLGADLAQALEGGHLSISGDNENLFVYTDTAPQAENAHAVILSELEHHGITATTSGVEHWLADEERWDGAAPSQDYDDELVSEGFAPWEVRIPARDHKAAVDLADRLEAEGYGVIRRWSFVIAGCADEEQARALAARLHGEVEAGGEMVYESMPQNPFRFFGGLADV